MVQHALTLGRWLNGVLIDTMAVAVVLWVCVVSVFIYGAMDDRTPFKVLSISRAVASPGGPLVIHSKVWRDMTRKCDVEIDRYLWLSVKTERGAELQQFPGVGGFVPAKEIARREATWPGTNITPVHMIPSNAAAGPGVLVTHLRYYCNAAHRLWRPIEYTYESPFTVSDYSQSASSGTTGTP